VYLGFGQCLTVLQCLFLRIFSSHIERNMGLTRPTMILARSSALSCMSLWKRTRISCRSFAVVFPQLLKAVEAAEIASFVSSNPISGTVPSSSAVAGSDTFRHQYSRSKLVKTHMCNVLWTLMVAPFFASTHFPPITLWNLTSDGSFSPHELAEFVDAILLDQLVNVRDVRGKLAARSLARRRTVGLALMVLVVGGSLQPCGGK
jgi:hypothetical protein